MCERCTHFDQCKFIQYLKDNNVMPLPDLEKIAQNCNRPAPINPVGLKIDVDSYGPQTRGEIKLAKDLNLL